MQWKTRAYRVIKVANGLLIIKMTQEQNRNMDTYYKNTRMTKILVFRVIVLGIW